MRAPARRGLAILLIALGTTAAGTEVRAAEPFPAVTLTEPRPRSHFWAYASLAGGAGLIGGSFAFSRHADDLYRQYLAATDPARIDQLYDDTVFHDRLSSASLLAGETLVVLGVYLRFIRRPAASRLGLTVAPARCALSWSF